MNEFVLQRVTTDTAAASQKLHLFGSYSTSEEPVVIDPLQTGHACPDAIAAHENSHQALTINTTFGVFTQLVTHMDESLASDAARRALAEQWSVQELAASYIELVSVARTCPGYFEKAYRSLPSMRLDQPPYREIVDAAVRWLPIGIDVPEQTLVAQAVLVQVLAYASLNTKCLLMMAAGPRTASTLLECCADSPHARFELLFKQLIELNQLEQLHDVVVQLRTEPSAPGTVERTLLTRLTELIPSVAVESEGVLHDQTRAAFRAWMSVLQPDWAIAVERSLADLAAGATPDQPLPAVRRNWGNPDGGPHEFQRLSAEALHERLELTQRLAYGLELDLAMRWSPPEDPSVVHVYARSYLLEPDASPLPLDMDEDDEPAAPLPDDIHGLMHVAEVLDELREFPTLPHCVVFTNDSWRNWDRLSGGRERFANVMKICRQDELSKDEILSNILPFEGLGEAPEAFIFRIRTGMYWGAFVPRAAGRAFGLQMLHSDYSVNLFLRICQELGVPQRADPENSVPERHMLNMVARNFYVA